jgi:hypothetical protein
MATDRRGFFWSDRSEHHQGGALSMHSVFYIIGVIVVVLAILSLLGLA